MENSFDNIDVAMLSSPGMGHLIPVLVLANRLAALHGVRVTVFLVTTSSAPPESKLLKLPLEQNVEIIELPPVDISKIVDPSAQVVTKLCVMVREAMPLFRSAVIAMDRRPAALIVDHFCTEVVPIAAELKMAKYIYAPSTARFTSLLVYSPVLDQEIEGEYVDQLQNLKIPGCKSVRPEDVVDPMLDRSDRQYYEYLRMGKETTLFDGLLLNTWEDLEPTSLKALRENKVLSSVMKIPVYPIGPLTRPAELDAANQELFVWLDQQPNDSVIFVSFGSGGVLSPEQIIELAWGLELSQQRFVWVVRPPTTGRIDDAFFGIKNSDDNPEFLPKGFLTRTCDVGKLVPNWAQQVKILGHPSIGGFLSHCGWNSTSESITSGVPMIAWPLYAEQRVNATFLAEELEIAVRPAVLPMKKVVGREEIEEMVRTLMLSKEGQAMRDKVRLLKISGQNAITRGGSSDKALCDILSKISETKNCFDTNGNIEGVGP